MKTIVVISLGVLSLFACESKESKPAEIKTLSFEETIRQHTQQYCDCAGPLNNFVDTVDAQNMDSVVYEQYQVLQAQFQQCFDPMGEKKSFRDNLTPEMKQRQKELFTEYRQEICPNIVPKS